MRISDWSSDVCSADLLIGGRVDTFYTNSNFHHAYERQAAKWEARSPLPTARSGHGAVLYRGRIFCMGSSAERRVGKECVSTWRSPWSPYLQKKTTQTADQTGHDIRIEEHTNEK